MEGDISGIEVFGNPVWFLRILRQEGLRVFTSATYKESASTTSFIKANFVKVVTPHTDDSESGAENVLITSHTATARYLGFEVKKKKAQYFSFDGISNVLMSTRVFSLKIRDSSDFEEFGGHLNSLGERIVGSGILVFREPGRTLISLPWDLSRTPEENRLFPTYLEKSWDEGIKILEVSPGIDSMAVRKAVYFMIRLAYCIAGRPLVRLSPSPSGPPLNIVRIDADGFTAESTEAVMSVSRKLFIPFSWFIDLHSWIDNSRDLFGISLESEVGIHCFHHLTFTSRKQNKANLELASLSLEKLGINWIGAVAPHGTWNKGLASALKAQEVIYSSEFSASEEDLPFTIKGVLQIPTPSYSLGVWTDRRNYWEYVDEQAIRQHKDHGVAILYDHPIGRLENHITEFEAYLRNHRDNGGRFVTMGEYCLMWLIRESELCDEPWLVDSVNSLKKRLGSKWNIESKKSYFALQKVECLPQTLTRSEFAQIKSSTSGIKQARWKLGPSIYLFILGLVPLQIHLAWSAVRNGTFNPLSRDKMK